MTRGAPVALPATAPVAEDRGRWRALAWIAIAQAAAMSMWFSAAAGAQSTGYPLGVGAEASRIFATIGAAEV